MRRGLLRWQPRDEVDAALDPFRESRGASKMTRRYRYYVSRKVELANKNARVLWALLARNQDYCAPAAA